MLSILKIKEFNAINIKFTEIMPSTLNSLIFNVDRIFSADLTIFVNFNIDEVKNQRI